MPDRRHLILHIVSTARKRALLTADVGCGGNLAVVVDRVDLRPVMPVPGISRLLRSYIVPPV